MITYQNQQGTAKKFQRKTISLAIISLLSSGHAFAQQSTNVDDPETIVVTGIRHSLESALDVKKNSKVVVDSINAEDIGKFPDSNIADSLQHVTGVQIARDRGGEGRFVSVRGLGSQFNMTTLNGRMLATDNAGRDFSFDVMPSELISEADIYKTSMASLQEGSIGGLISLHTRKPLDNPGLHVNGSVGGLYDEGTEKWGDKASIVVSDSFMDDTLGVSLGITQSQREWKSDTYELLQAKRYIAVDSNGDGINDANAWMPDIPSFQHKYGTRNRIGVAGAIEFKPNDQIDSTVDFFYSDYKTPERSYSYNMNLGTSSGIKVTDIKPWSTPSKTSDGIPIDYEVTGFTTEKSDLEMGNDTRDREAKTYMVGWNTIYQATDKLKFNVDLAYSKAESPNKGDELYTVAGLTPVSYTWTSGTKVPHLGCTTTDGRQCWDVTNDDIGLHFMELKGTAVKDEVTSTQFGGDYDFEFLNLDSTLEFGVTYSDREKSKDEYKSPDGCAYCKSFTEKLDMVGINAVTGKVKYDTGADSGLTYWPALDPYALFAAAREFDNVRNEVGTFDSKIAPAHNLRASTLYKETITGAYLQWDFKTDDWDANAGVRWVQTKITSSGYAQNITAYSHVSGSSNYSTTFGPTEAVSVDSKYNNLLPSASLNYSIAENLKLRAGVSQTITRPTISQLGTDVNWEVNSGVPTVNFNGNPDLKPIKSNNIDLSLEWYGTDGLSASVGTYYKDITDWIFTGGKTVTYNVLVTEDGAPPVQQNVNFSAGLPLNGDKASLTGVEASFQKLFDNGFGVQLNYTFADTTSTTTVNGVKVDGELDGVSKNTYNVVGFYENDKYSLRTSYTFRDKYVAGARQGNWGNPLLNPSFASLDVSATYNINESISLYAQGENLLEAYGQTYWGDKLNTHYFEQYSRRFEIGARFKF